MNPKRGYSKGSGWQWGNKYSTETRLKLGNANTQKKTVYQYILAIIKKIDKSFHVDLCDIM